MQPDNIVVFDGVCKFCSGWVQFIIARDPSGLFHFAPMQSKTGRSLLERFCVDPDDVTTFVFIKEGKAYVRSEAALQIAREFAWPWQFLRIARVVPAPIRDALYNWVARNRYRWFGKTDTCMVPSADIKARFLD